MRIEIPSANGKRLQGFCAAIVRAIIVIAVFASGPVRAEAILDIDQNTPSTMDTAMDDQAHVDELDRIIKGDWIPALVMMTEQLTTTMMEQVLIVGTFMDAKHQLETQRLIQDMDTQAMKAFQPSVQMCIMGTNMRSLTASQQKAAANTVVINNALLSRSLSPRNQLTGSDKDADLLAREGQYYNIYCNPNDNYLTLAGTADTRLCFPAPPIARRNRDLDFTRLVDGPETLNIDFTDAALTHDEEDVLALSRNLFSHDLFAFIPQDLITQGPRTGMGPGATVFQTLRSLQAVRGVAANSFAHIVGMKTKGTGLSNQFLLEIIRELGLTPDEAQKLIGGIADNGAAMNQPSYFAQMGVLTKRIYMAPDFFVNLFTQPANVERMGATLQAIKLMQDRDRYEASLRREMLISLIVEMKIREKERDVDGKLISSLPDLYLQ